MADTGNYVAWNLRMRRRHRRLSRDACMASQNEKMEVPPAGAFVYGSMAGSSDLDFYPMNCENFKKELQKRLRGQVENPLSTLYGWSFRMLNAGAASDNPEIYRRGRPHPRQQPFGQSHGLRAGEAAAYRPAQKCRRKQTARG